MQKLGFELAMLTHTKQGPNFREENLKKSIAMHPHMVFLIGGEREAISLSYFKSYEEYKSFKQRMPNVESKIFVEEPITFKILLNDIKFTKIDFLEAAKRMM
jgi:hypothetical protein